MLITITKNKQDAYCVKLLLSILLLFPDIGTAIHLKMFKNGSQWKCKECSYQSALKNNVYEHVEAKHIEHSGYACQFCDKVLKTKGSLRVHMNSYHKGL